MNHRVGPTMLLALSLMACSLVDGLLGSGAESTRQYEVDGFQSIDICCGFRAVLSGGDRFAVEVTAEVSVLPHVQASIVGDTLRLSVAADQGAVLLARTLEARITMPELHGVALSGGTRLRLEEPFPVTSELMLEASGGSRAELDGIQAETASVRLSGASSASVTVTGNLNYDLDGGSHLDFFGHPTIGDATTSGGASATEK